MKRLAVLGLLFVAIFASALQLVLSRYEARRLFVALQELRKERDELDREWGRLLLEQGTWGTHGRVEEIARTRLQMTVPAPERVYRVRS